MISHQNTPEGAMRDLVRACATREYIQTGKVINDYDTNEPEYQWCQERIDELQTMALALGSADMLRLQLKIHVPLPGTH